MESIKISTRCGETNATVNLFGKRGCEIPIEITSFKKDTSPFGSSSIYFTAVMREIGGWHIVAPIPIIDKVIFNNPATIVYWKDGSKTVVKCQKDDTYSKEIGLAMCICKKALGNKGNYNNILKHYTNDN